MSKYKNFDIIDRLQEAAINSWLEKHANLSRSIRDSLDKKDKRITELEGKHVALTRLLRSVRDATCPAGGPARYSKSRLRTDINQALAVYGHKDAS